MKTRKRENGKTRGLLSSAFETRLLGSSYQQSPQDISYVSILGQSESKLLEKTYGFDKSSDISLLWETIWKVHRFPDEPASGFIGRLDR